MTPLEHEFTFSKLECMMIRMALNKAISALSDDLSRMVSVPYDERGEDWQVFFDRIADQRRRRQVIVDTINEKISTPPNPYLNR